MLGAKLTTRILIKNNNFQYLNSVLLLSNNEIQACLQLHFINNYSKKKIL